MRDGSLGIAVAVHGFLRPCLCGIRVSAWCRSELRRGRSAGVSVVIHVVGCFHRGAVVADELGRCRCRGCRPGRVRRSGMTAGVFPGVPVGASIRSWHARLSPARDFSVRVVVRLLVPRAVALSRDVHGGLFCPFEAFRIYGCVLLNFWWLRSAVWRVGVVFTSLFFRGGRSVLSRGFCWRFRLVFREAGRVCAWHLVALFRDRIRGSGEFPLQFC